MGKRKKLTPEDQKEIRRLNDLHRESLRRRGKNRQSAIRITPRTPRVK